MGEQTKRCTKCQRDLPVVTYYRRRTDRGMRYNSWCRSCLADNSREYQRSERGRSKYLLKTYGLTADQLAAMFEAQEHRCARSVAARSTRLIGTSTTITRPEPSAACCAGTATRGSASSVMIRTR